MNFSYEEAFSRNIGWITPEEAQKLRGARVAIAGMGGVGGSHLITLTRLGVGNFHIADFDKFEIQNFNRQSGADLSTVGRPKVDVMAERALLINPELKINIFSEGITDQNIDAFLEGIDIYADGLDAFVLEMREKIFTACRQKGIPVVSVGPIGMGGAMITFMPKGMSFTSYFGFGKNAEENFYRFVLGITPSFMQLKYLVIKSSTNAQAKRAPSTPMGCELASGILATQCLKIILKRGKIYPAPWTVHFDSYLAKIKKKYLWWGHRNPLFQLRLFLIKMIFMRKK